MLTALQVEVNCAVMTELLIGYARVSTNEQDLTAQQNALERLGVRSNLIYTDHGLTGTNRARPGLREALAACRSGDTLVVAKLDRLARSLRDAKDIVDELTAKEVKLSIGGSVHDPNDRSAGSSSTSSPWSRNSSQISSALERKRACRWRKQRADCAANHRSSPRRSRSI